MKQAHIEDAQGLISRIKELEDLTDYYKVGWRQAKDRIKELEAALRDLLNHYIALVESGDAGHWNPNEEKEVIKAKKALSSSPAQELKEAVADPREECARCGCLRSSHPVKFHGIDCGGDYKAQAEPEVR